MANFVSCCQWQNQEQKPSLLTLCLGFFEPQEINKGFYLTCTFFFKLTSSLLIFIIPCLKRSLTVTANGISFESCLYVTIIHTWTVKVFLLSQVLTMHCFGVGVGRETVAGIVPSMSSSNANPGELCVSFFRVRISAYLCIWQQL